MERRVKERLIGATILVVLVVLIVPEFLPGTPHPPADSREKDGQGNLLRYIIDDEKIATQPPAAQGPASGAVAPAAASAPPSAVMAAAVEPPSPAAPPAPEQVTPPPPVPAATVPRSATGGGWTVQVGSFASRANAETLQRQIKGEGFTVYISPIGAGAAMRYRVRLGPVADRAAAAAIMQRLQAHKHAATLVPPAG